MLAPYPFRDRPTAYHNLMALAREDFPFLSQARCRHFLAAIAPRLLEAVGRTPDPDMTLTNLEKVSASLGAKAILWELFNFNPPSLRLYVELCATSQFLSEILINNPGMIDDLVDSLVVDRPSPGAAIKAELAELVQGGRGPGADPLELPQQGVGADRHPRHPGPRADPRGHPRAGRRRRGDRHPGGARPVAAPGRRGSARRGAAADGRRDRWAILGLGKFGGRELNYHSDLDLVFLHEADGKTAGGPASISNDQFVTEVVQRVLKALGSGSATGPLYAVDARLRPHGASGPLVLTLDAFRDYLERSTQTWERMALTRARVIFATGGFGRQVTEAIRSMLAAARRSGPPRRAGAGDATQARGLAPAATPEARVRRRRRHRVHRPVPAARPCRAPAGLAACPTSGMPSTRSADREILDPRTHAELRDAYDFLRAVEGRLRLIQNRSVGELPQSPVELERLARRLNYESADRGGSVAAFLADLEAATSRTRGHFDRIVTAAAHPPGGHP